MRSLHFCTSDAWGGLENYACTLMADLNGAGVEVTAVCTPNSKVSEFLAAHRIPVVHLPSRNPVSLRSASLVRSIIRARDIDVLHVHFHSDVWPASLALTGDHTRKLYLSIYMGVPPKNDLFHRFIYRRVDAIFTSSAELNAKLPTLYPVPASKVHFLPYGRHLDEYTIDAGRRSEIREALGFKDSDLVVGTMIRIDPGKGVMDFARSLLYIDPALRDRVKYLIVGEPTRAGRRRADGSPYEPRSEQYRREIESFLRQEHFSDRVILAGYQADVVGYLGAMDIFVFPSRDELYSLVVLDAMAMGLPVVAARAGGNLRQIDEGINGLLYAVADSRDLAAKVMKYLNSPTLRCQHGRAARRFVEEHHSMSRTIDHLLHSYNK